MKKSWIALLLCLLLAFPLLPASAEPEGVTRALLVGIDSFVSRSGMSPAAGNNVAALEEILVGTAPLQEIVCATGSSAPADAEELRALLSAAFDGADASDLLLIYFCTHGTFDGEGGGMLLSDGSRETVLTPRELADMLAELPGRKLLVLDACNSGLFIGAGVSDQGGSNPFGQDTAVLTSCAASENSWFWTDAAGSAQGSFYFTMQLCDGMDPRCGAPADANEDGSVTLSELYGWILTNHGTSTPQLYAPEGDWQLAVPQLAGRTSAIRDITFSADAVKAGPDASLTVEFTASRPVCVAYQITRMVDGAWDFAGAQILYDGAERYTTLGEMAGAVTAGRKSRTIDLSGVREGYVLLQLISLDDGQITVHAGHVTAVTNASCDTDVSLQSTANGMYRVFIPHSRPCVFTVTLTDDADGSTLTRLYTRTASRPDSIGGTELFLPQRLLSPYAGHVCRLKVKVDFGSSSVTVLSAAFAPEE